MTIYQSILDNQREGKKSLAVLIDPDTPKLQQEKIITLANKTNAAFIFLGGSLLQYPEAFEENVVFLKQRTTIPIILFPGDNTQVSESADALLLLSLISGRNPEYLIGQHVKAAKKLKALSVELISTGYILVDGGSVSTTQKVTQTQPILATDIPQIVSTAIAAEQLGMKLIYLEAGSGARNPVSAEIIHAVKKEVSLPVICGGGVRNVQTATQILQAGADILVLGNVLEKDPDFLEQVKGFL